MRQALKSLLQSIGVRVEAFGSAADFLRNARAENGAGCLVLDVRLPGLSGLDFQAELAKADVQIGRTRCAGVAARPLQESY